MNSNKSAKDQLNMLYGVKCLLTGIKGERYLTYHHLQKKEDGGKATIINGANLIDHIHSWLHNIVERNDPELFDLINECLQLYKICIDENRTELIEQYESECMPEFNKKYIIYRNRKRANQKG